MSAKRFVPLENNPEVMNSLVHKLGLSKSLGFVDVYSIDDPDLLSFVPRPAHALMLIFPVSETYENSRHAEDASLPEYQGSGPNEEVMWFKQTIGNACGLIGLLHSSTNGYARTAIEPNSDLAKLVQEAEPLKAVERANMLYESNALEAAHADAATQGDTNAPDAEQSVDLHFVAFVKSSKGNLWEMDGRRKGPLLRGTLSPDEDVLSEKALDLGVRSFLKREASGAGQDLRFSLIALTESFD